MKIFIAALVLLTLLFVCGVGAGATRGSDRIDTKNPGVPDIAGLFARKVEAGELAAKAGCVAAAPMTVAAGATCTLTLKASGAFGLRRMTVTLLGNRLDVSWDKPFVNNVSLRRAGTQVALIFTGDETTLTLKNCVPLGLQPPQCMLLAK